MNFQFPTLYLGKKNILTVYFLVILLASFCWPLPTTVFAQEELSDYQFEYEQYRKLYKDFSIARDKYLQYDTLVSRQEAVETTQKLLIQRSQVLRTHFLLLKRRLNQAPNIIGTTRTRLVSNLDTWIEKLDKQRQEIEALQTPSLSQLFEISLSFERSQDEYRLLSYEVVSRILIGSVQQYQSEAVAINFLLNERINQVNTNQIGVLKNWLDEAKNSAYWSQQGIVKAEQSLEELLKFRGQSEETLRQFAKIQENLLESKGWLSKLVGFQGEIIDSLTKGENE